MSEINLILDEEFCCGAARPTHGFTFHASGVTVCDECGLKFPYYDCFCELAHDCIAPVECPACAEHNWATIGERWACMCGHEWTPTETDQATNE